MTGMRPLASAWRIRAAGLPEDMTGDAPAFRLPGTEDLAAFADLLGEDAPDAPADAPAQDAPFPLPAPIPPRVTGPVELCCEVDFGSLRAQEAELIIEQIQGRGRAYLDEEKIASFAPGARGQTPGALVLPLTRALQLGRKQTLRLCFDETRPAGVCGPVTLHLSSRARLEDVRIRPDALHQAMRLYLTVCAREAGTYILRAQAACPSCADAPPPWEITLRMDAGERRETELSVSAPAPRFVPGTAYDAPAVKIQLFSRTRPSSALPGMPCDSMTLLCGYPGRAAAFDLPLTPAECFLPPQTLLERIGAMRLPGVLVSVPAPDAFYRAMTRAGVAVRQIAPANAQSRFARYPCVACQDAPEPRERAGLVASAWQMCAMTGCTRTPPPGATDDELLCELAGREIDRQHAHAALLWLRATHVRLRAEAARQGKLTGALCTPGEWNDPDTYAALQTALAPTHLSALPLWGAWWAGSHFSATLFAFLERETDGLTAHVTLEDEQGNVVEQLTRPCPPAGGDLGVLRATLPGSPCALTLCTKLTQGDSVVEQSQIPVYVGLRGVLEGAF